MLVIKRRGHKIMDDFNLDELNLSKRVKRKLKNKKSLRKQLANGASAQDILEISDETIAKFYGAAHRLFERGFYKDAQNAFLFLVTLNPRIYDYWVGLGMSAQKCGDYETAVDAYEMAAIHEIESPVPYFYLAKCLFALHDRENALKALDLALEYAADSVDYLDLRNQALKARELLMGNE